MLAILMIRPKLRAIIPGTTGHLPHTVGESIERNRAAFS